MKPGSLIGTGTSRRVYLLGEDVIKIAKGPAGMSQNRVEARLSRDPEIWPGVARVLSHSADYAWTICQRAKPLSRGVFTFDWEQECSDEAVKAVNRLIKKYRLIPGDIDKRSSWGRLGKEFVLLDFGLTPHVFQKHYSPKTESLYICRS